MTKSPAFQFYPDDFVGSGKVGTMTAEEVGIYTLLLCLEWNETGFVYNAVKLARWCRTSRKSFDRAWLAVSGCFVEREGKLFNPRLDTEREKQAVWREKSSKGGKLSAEARRKGGSTVVQPPHQPNGNTPSPTPFPSKRSLPAAPTAPASPAANGTPTNWVAEALQLWTKSQGAISAGHLGRYLKPVVAAYGWPETRLGLGEYLAEGGLKKSPAWFAKDAARWIAEAKVPLVDDWGCLTIKGQRLAKGA